LVKVALWFVDVAQRGWGGVWLPVLAALAVHASPGQTTIFNKSAAALPIPETVFPYTDLRLISYMRCIAQEN
jgi:hypothetical protein